MYKRQAPAFVLGKIIGQLPGEGAAIEVQIARFVHPVQLFGQVFLIIIALALDVYKRQPQWR